MTSKDIGDLLAIIGLITVFWVVISGICAVWHYRRAEKRRRRDEALDRAIADVTVRKHTYHDHNRTYWL